MNTEQERAKFEAWWAARQPASSIKEDAFAAYQEGRRPALQSQDREDALTDAVQKAIELLGPEAPLCSGCAYEWNHALHVLRAAIDHARRVEGEGE